MNVTDLGFTADQFKQLIVESAAEKLADQIAREEAIPDRVEEMIRARVEKAIGEGLEARVEATLTATMESVMRETITPVNIWGERAGEPTTLRDALAARARVFWDVRVDKDGKPSTYGGTPRHEHLMKQMLNEEFTAAIRENATVVVAAFKEAVRGDAARLLGEHIEKLMPARPR
jgi:hypothetical protein